MDGSGLQESGLSASRSLRENGCILNQRGIAALSTPLSAINEHPVFDAARRWSQVVRIIPRRQIVGYAVENGKSVIWCRRYALGTGGPPSKVAVTEGLGEIKNGYEYVVEGSGSIAYDVATFAAGEHFVGQSGVTDFSTISGSPVVYELQTGMLEQPGGADLFGGIAERIAHVAPPGGFTNQWVLGFQWKAYHPSVSSLWKPTAYSDYFALNDRACFYAPEIANDPALFWHFAYGQRVPGRYGGTLVAEVPTGYRYSPCSVLWSQDYVNDRQGGDSDDWAKFAKSARIYEPPCEVEAAEAVTEGTEALVKLTLTGRLHSTYGQPDGAGASISRDVSTWDLDALQGEPFVTDETLLRRYLANQATGRNFVASIGDNAWNSVVQSLPDNPYSSCFPHLYLVKLVPEPWADSNDAQDRSDTPFVHDPMAIMGSYLPPMIEACVDQEQSFDQLLRYVEENAVLPDTWGLHDYTREECFRQAFEAPWLGIMPTEPTPYIDQVRPDMPHGFGPPPATLASAEVFNRFSRTVNLLTKFRLMIPYIVETRDLAYSGQTPADLPATCTLTGTVSQYQDAADPPDPKTPVGGYPTYWEAATDAVAYASGALEATETAFPACDYFVGAFAIHVEWRATLEPGIEGAFPPIVADLWAGGNVGLLTYRVTERQNSRRVAVPYAESSPMNGQLGWWTDGTDYFAWTTGSVDEHQVEAEIIWARDGALMPGRLPASDLAIGRDPSMPNSTFDRAGSSQATTTWSFLPGSTLLLEVPLAD